MHLKKVPVQTKMLTEQGSSKNKTRLAKFISFYFPFISGRSEKIVELESSTSKVAELQIGE